MKLTNGMDRAHFHDKAWALYQAKALDDAKLPKMSIYAIRTLWDVLYDSMPANERATPADHSLSLTDKQLMILNNSSFRLYAKGEKRASLKLDAVIAELSIPENLTQKLSHIDKQGYAHMKVSDDTKGPRGVDDAAGRDRSVPRTGDQNDPELSPGQCAIEEAIGKLHTAKSPLADKENVAALIQSAIDKLNWISANPESFSATPVDHSVPVAIPEGWQLVPKRADDAMKLAAWKLWSSLGDAQHQVWVAMLAAAPQPPQKDADHIEARLDKPAQVGNGRFGVGVKWSTVIGAAQRHHDYMNTPEKERDRIAMGKEFFERFGEPQAPQSDAQSVRDAVSVPPDVMAALNRMCSPLHESWLTGVTAQEDARCMKLIRDYVLAGRSVQCELVSGDEKAEEIEECCEILSSLISNIETDGLYSAEAMCTFLRQALQCLKSAPPQKPVSDEVRP
ncbi:hypothetical protein [Caballeronia sp. DA-9]|uniref:hypothetical protein n=1 Tax=Caballeronia sp. DA-9 TaxID=3436237 RepID=UPI003F67348C